MGTTKEVLLEEVGELEEPLTTRALDYIRGLRDATTLENEAYEAAGRLGERRLKEENSIPYNEVRKKLGIA